MKSGNVKTLGLQGCQIGVEGAKYVVDGLRHNKTLTQLDLSLNKMGDKGVAVLAGSLRDVTFFTKADLYSEQMRLRMQLPYTSPEGVIGKKNDETKLTIVTELIWPSAEELPEW
eukprot:TRINITY_DN40324_c0_g1_i1.p1 TRINITY_DN40324_c0_g1~~TRINITY_DN40324_c0_g1_i1.p1  ORF type:complete len:114 (-),score=11.58 TRINITY_DN40324_c0_g1_i1:899-1240(-)